MTFGAAGDLSPSTPDAEHFFSGAVRRILKFLLVAALVLLVPTWWFFGLVTSVGFLAGALVSWLNFQFLARGIEGIASRIVDHHSRERSAAVLLRFALRYVLVAGVAYAIFGSSAGAFRGFLFGVCLPALAMLMEAAYEGYSVVRRGY
jgi:hypothetical protein